MSNAFSGAASAQRINEALDIEESQRRFMESVSDEEPMTWREFAGLMLIGVASWGVVGLAFYGATKLAEAMR